MPLLLIGSGVAAFSLVAIFLGGGTARWRRANLAVRTEGQLSPVEAFAGGVWDDVVEDEE